MSTKLMIVIGAAFVIALMIMSRILKTITFIIAAIALFLLALLIFLTVSA